LACGRISPGPKGGKNGLVAAAGCTVDPCFTGTNLLPDVNFLDYGSNTWRPGPALPLG